MDPDRKEASPREMGRLLQGIGILLIGIAALIYALKSFPRTPEQKYYEQILQQEVQRQQILHDPATARPAGF